MYIVAISVGQHDADRQCRSSFRKRVDSMHGGMTCHEHFLVAYFRTFSLGFSSRSRVQTHKGSDVFLFLHSLNNQPRDFDAAVNCGSQEFK